MQEGKASPPERSVIICWLRSTTFLPVHKTPVAHRLEMVTFPRRFLSTQEETFCRGEDVTSSILQDSYYPISVKMCWIGSYFCHASFLHFSWGWSSIFNFFLRGNTICIIVPLLLIAKYCSSTHTMLYSLSKTVIKSVILVVLGDDLLMGNAFKLFFYFSISVLSTVSALNSISLASQAGYNRTIFCSLLDSQRIFELCLFLDLYCICIRKKLFLFEYHGKTMFSFSHFFYKCRGILFLPYF